MAKTQKKSFNYHLNIALRHIAKELLRLFYHTVYRVLAPGRRFYCQNIFKGHNALVFANGEVTCVCADHGLINLGNVNHHSLKEIWTGEDIEKLRDSFKRNRLPLHHCSACFALEKLKNPPPDAYDIAPFFWNIHIETTPVCNLDCAICQRDEVEKHRGDARLTPDVVKKLLDEIAANQTNKFLMFFGFGEPFLDNNIYEYINYIKAQFPEIIVSISTNGIPLDNQQNVEKLLDTKIDVLVFSIDGITQEEYVKYRRGGNLERALGGMEKLAKTRNERGQETPYIIWQYLYFKWNDSDRSIRATVEHARKIGIDLLHFLPTRTPITGISWKNLLKRNKGVMYKFGHLDINYNPHDRAKMIQVTDDMRDIPI